MIVLWCLGQIKCFYNIFKTIYRAYLLHNIFGGSVYNIFDVLGARGECRGYVRTRQDRHWGFRTNIHVEITF